MSTSTMNAAKETINAAKDTTQSAARDVKGSMMEVVRTVGEALAFIRRLGIDDALGVAGLARRRSGFADAGVFASGVLVGAGIGVLLSPVSGAEARAFLLGRIRAAIPDADQAKPIVEEVELAEKKAEGVAHDVAKAVAHAANNGSHAARHAADKVEHKIKSAAHKHS